MLIVYLSRAVTTKVGSVGDIRGTLEKALKELGVAHVDLYLIHTPAKLGTDGYPTHEEAWKTMEELKVRLSSLDGRRPKPKLRRSWQSC